MRRTNSYDAYALISLNPEMKACVCEWLAASCAYWNEVNYHRFQSQLDTGDWENADNTELSELYDEYAPVLGTANAQQLKAKNNSAWEGYDKLVDKYDEPNDGSVTDEPGFPGFWGNRNDGYDMKSVVRNTAYSINHSADQSTLEISVGKALDQKYNLSGRGHKVRFRLKGEPRWKGYVTVTKFGSKRQQSAANQDANPSL